MITWGILVISSVDVFVDPYSLSWSVIIGLLQ